MGAQHWIPERGARRSFSTRIAGHNLARKVWLCVACRGWNEAVRPSHDAKPAKPAACRWCSGNTWLKCDSSVEAQHFAWLWRLQDDGRISGLRHHPRFPIVVWGPSGWKPVTYYEADASYTDAAGELVVEDVKPKSEQAQDPVFRLKRKIVEHQHAIRIRIVNVEP